MNRTLKISLITVGGLLIAGILGTFISRSISHWRHIRSMDEEITYTLEAPRGEIYDVDGHIIATSTTAYDVYLECALIQSDAEWKEKTTDLAPRLALLLPERNAAQWWDYLQAGRKENQGYLNIAKGITADIKDSLASLPIFNMNQLKGAAIYLSYLTRVYPHDSLARRTIGYVHAYEIPGWVLKGNMIPFLRG